MKRIFSIIIAGGLLLIAFAVPGQAQPAAPPLVAQILVREGEFALKLAEGLRMGSPGSEAEAEGALASAGIAPRNGWIADYPITPDIAGELEIAIARAADSGMLPLSREEALMAFQGLIAETGLPVAADTPGEVVQNYPPADYGQYSNPDVINNYYYDQGPPVVTYYPPPQDYSYMYSWVPYPFLYSGFRFSGYFILNDFHRPVYGHGGPCFVSNHYRDRDNHRVYTVDPVRRHNGSDFRREGGPSHGRGTHSEEARRGATSIFERSRSGNAPNGMNPTRPEGRFEAGYSANRGSSPPVSSSRTSVTERPSATWRTRNEAAPRSSGERPSSQQRNFEGHSGSPSVGSNRSFTAPPTSSNRFFSPPSGGVNRSFTPPSVGSRNSFGGSSRAPSMSSNRSFGSPSGGVSRSSTSPSLGSRNSSGSSFKSPSTGSNRPLGSPSGGVSRSFTSPSPGSRSSLGSSSGSSSGSPSPGGSSRSFGSPPRGTRGSSGSSFRGF